MSTTLADVLAKIDDPETLSRILEVSDELDSDSTSTSTQDQPTLSELYTRYLNRRQNRSPSTIAQYKRTLPDFLSFAESEDVDFPTDITTAVLDRYVDNLQETHNSDSTILTYTKNVRAWLQWLQRRQLCTESVYQVLDRDELGLTPKARDEAIPPETARAILGKLRGRRRGTDLHASLELFWNGGTRIGDVHSLDINDFDPENQRIRLRHRPETGTRLKNGNEEDGTSGDGERDITLRESAIQALQRYIDLERPDVTDEYGREPLFSTTRGRASKSTLRRWIYEATSCRWSPETDERECAGDCDTDSHVCPCSYYPHAIRRGSIVTHLANGLGQSLAKQRFDVSIKVIDRHYDPRTKEKERRDREGEVRAIWAQLEGYNNH
jgi:site-specific recombinase XerD